MFFIKWRYTYFEILNLTKDINIKCYAHGNNYILGNFRIQLKWRQANEYQNSVVTIVIHRLAGSEPPTT